MLIDTHCHLNLMAKDSFNTPLKPEHFILIEKIIHQAKQVGINKIITVGTSLIESYNCTEIAQRFDGVYASVGIHPHDLTAGWKTDFDSIKELVSHKKLVEAYAKLNVTESCDGVLKYLIGIEGVDPGKRPLLDRDEFWEKYKLYLSTSE